MTQDEIIEMAKTVRSSGYWDAFDLINFAKLVAAKEREFWIEQLNVDIEEAIRDEREACAELRKTLSAIPNGHVPQLQPAVESALDFYAERIRARGEA